MLKRKASPYVSGRPKGHWWKWKRAALTLDCVLMYAQPVKSVHAFHRGIWKVFGQLQK